jgi:hypothetical protein
MNVTGTIKKRARPAIAALAAVMAAAAVAAASPAATAAPKAGSGQTGVRSAVPWSRVGPGWVLAESWFGSTTRKAPVRLWLVDPAGGRYLIRQWAATRNPFGLIDWSGDKTRALLSLNGTGRVEQVTLATGRVSRFSMPREVSILGYTRPDGLNLLGIRGTSQSGAQLLRYSLTGQLQKTLATVDGGANPLYSPSGQVIAVGTVRGMALVSNAGGIVRRLSFRGSGLGCTPARWWNSSTILASCLARGSSRSRLWLVPASGSRPTALTPVRGNYSPDLGDLDAWRLPSGLYLESSGACSSFSIFRQAANGTIRRVNVPFPAGNDVILGSYRDQLLITAQGGCRAGSSLMWFNPASRHLHVLFRSGLISEVPYGEPFARY